MNPTSFFDFEDFTKEDLDNFNKFHRINLKTLQEIGLPR